MDQIDQTAFAILMGGTLTPTARLKAMVADRRTVAADGGMRHAAALGLTPELWVGDFDSTSDDLLSAFPDVPRMPYPAAKNETDGEIAIAEALSRGARSIVLPGALGGERSDHAFMHLLLAVRLAEQGLDIVMTSGDEEAYPILAGTRSIALPAGTLFSILGLTALDGLSIAGARYPLADFHLPFGSSRTISNVAEGQVTVTLHSGRAVLLARPQDFSGT